MSSQNELNTLQCGLSKYFHFVEKPKQMSCGHFFCQDCLTLESAIGIKCEICGKENEVESSKLGESLIIKMFFKMKIKDICVAAEKQFENSLKKVKDVVDGIIQHADVNINYWKEEVELRIESLKIELDKLNENLQSKLNEMKIRIESDMKLVEIEKHEKALVEYKSLIKEKEIENEAYFYENQKAFMNLFKKMDDLEKYNFQIKFDPSNKLFDDSIVGLLDINLSNEWSLKYNIQNVKKVIASTLKPEDSNNTEKTKTKKSTNSEKFNGETNDDLIDYLYSNDLIRSKKVLKVMLNVDRGFYAPSNPYMDSPQPIGHGINISAPHMHARALELLKDHLNEGAKALDIACGSGYLTACMATLCGRTGKAIGIENNEDLIKIAKNNISKDKYLAEKPELLCADGRLGYLKGGPYNAIHIGAAIPELSQIFLDQIAIGGRLIAPIGNKEQKFTQVDKLTDGSIKITELFGVIYRQLK